MKFKKAVVSIKKEEQPQRTPDPIPLPVPEPPKRTGIYEATCISQAQNPQWIYVKFMDIDGKHPVVIPRRLTGKLVGKRVHVEAITDATGTSYRYVQSPV